ncbi:MAG: ArsR family transcriptional regulator [Bacillota bacterium]
MQTVVMAPESLLLDRDLLATAKLLWLLLQLEPEARNPGLLAARSGLNPKTVARGLAQLEGRAFPATGRKAGMPAPLLLDRRLSSRARLLYGLLQFTPGFRREAGQCTLASLTPLTGWTRNPVRSAIGLLQETGWLELSQRNCHSPIRFHLRNPVAERQERATNMARRRLKKAEFKGEAIMREYLSLLIDSDQFEDNASPGFLVNPYTGEEMQFDRFYPPDVAFEFNGAQHFGPTARYPDEEKARRQMGRDYIKMGICISRSIRLVVLLAEDLSLDGIRRKVDGLLPLRDLTGQERLINYLERVARNYRSEARKQSE